MPGRADLPWLLELLGGTGRDEAALAEQALARYPGIFAVARAKMPEAEPPARARLCGLVGVAAATDPEAVELLAAALADRDPRTRRTAAAALGRVRDPRTEGWLVEAWQANPQLELRRTIASSLGKIGGAEALALLEAASTDDAELARILEEARLRLQRTLKRGELSTIRAGATAGRPLEVVLHCRRGLEEIVVEQLGRGVAVGPGLVRARLGADERLDWLWRARSALGFGLELPARDAGPESLGAVGRRLVGALTAPETLALLRRFAEGRIRYRVEWASAGHRRGLTYRCAAEISRLAPELHNDPTESPWHVVVRDAPLVVEIVPRALADPRFSYRAAQVPASSHPTIAAALAWVAGVDPNDVVWDPFVGAGGELVERARLGPFRHLLGTDLDPRALEAARQNLDAAGLQAELVRADAREYSPAQRPTLILTNPPMGRRVGNRNLTGELLETFLRHAAQVLAPGGRLVWISVRARDSAELASSLGLTLRRECRVDMAGFWGILQRFERPASARAARSSDR